MMILVALLVCIPVKISWTGCDTEHGIAWQTSVLVSNDGIAAAVIVEEVESPDGKFAGWCKKAWGDFCWAVNATVGMLEGNTNGYHRA